MQMNLIRAVKFFEKNAVAAIRARNVDQAIIALSAHPLVNSYSLATKLVKGYLKAHKKYAGTWR